MAIQNKRPPPPARLILYVTITVILVSSSDGVVSAVPVADTLNYNALAIGLNAHTWDADTPYFAEDRYFDLVKATGISWIRLNAVNPFSRASSMKLSQFIEALHDRGIRVLIVLSNNLVGNNARFSYADWNISLASFLDSFALQVDAWEVWNEPNYPRFRLGYMDGSAQHYVDLLRSAHEMIKGGIRPNVPVIFGGLAPTDNAVGFARQALDLGAYEYFDAFGFHIYGGRSYSFLRTITSLTGSKPVWITEVGIDSLRYGLEGQARQLHVLLDYLQRRKNSYNLEISFVYCWMDYAKTGDVTNVFQNPTSVEDFFGLVGVNLEPKPAFYKVRAIALLRS